MGGAYTAGTPAGRFKAKLTGAADSSFADGEGARSTLGQVYWLNHCLIGYDSKLSTRVLSSSTDAECAALVLFGKENAWLRDLLNEMKIFVIQGPTVVDEDNSAAITLSSKFGPSKGSRHFSIAWHICKDRVVHGEIEIVKVNTLDNCADLFTKQLAVGQFTKLRDKIMGSEQDQNYFLEQKKIVGHANTTTIQEQDRMERKPVGRQVPPAPAEIPPPTSAPADAPGSDYTANQEKTNHRETPAEPRP